MRLLELLPVALSMYHLVLAVKLYRTCGEVIELSELFAAGHEVLLADGIQVEAWILIVCILIHTFLIHNMDFIWRKYEGLSRIEE